MAASTEVARQNVYTTEALRSIASFDDALSIAAQAFGGEIVTADRELGDGFAILDNKASLIETPLLFMEWEFYPGEYGEFVAARVVAKVGNDVARYIVNDGSTGIYQQLRDYTDDTGRKGGLLSRKGLRRSDYEYEDGKGNKRPATTYYIDTAAA